MATGMRKAGEFCWINMLTPQPAEARAFFGALLGWEYDEIPGIGHSVRVGADRVGGLFDLEGPNTPPGLHPYIGVMVKVEGADDVCSRVKALGGMAKPAFDVGPQGRMAVCHDPVGAELDIWEPGKLQGFEVDGRRPGAPCWFELLTTDVARAAAFYSELFGWTPEPEPAPMPGSSYTNFTLGGVPVAGMFELTPEMGGLRPHWGTYFAVTDADEAARKTAELGGRIGIAPRDIPGIGRFCGLISPQGVGFYVTAYR